MKTKVMVLSVVLLLLLTAASIARANTVTGFVTPAEVIIQVEVVPASVDYGTVLLGQIATTTSGFTLTNFSNVPVDVDISGTSACEYDSGTAGCKTGGVIWGLAATQGADQYVHELGIGLSPSSWTALGYTGQILWNDMIVGDSQDFQLRISMPTTSSSTSKMTMEVLFVASQS